MSAGLRTIERRAALVWMRCHRRDGSARSCQRDMRSATRLRRLFIREVLVGRDTTEA